MPAGNEPDVFFVCTRQFKFQEKLEAFLVAFQELNLELNQTWYFVCTRKFKLTSWAFPEGLLLQVLEPSPSGQGSNLDQILKLWNQDTNLSWTRNDKLEDFCTDGLQDLTQIWNWYATRNVARNHQWLFQISMKLPLAKIELGPIYDRLMNWNWTELETKNVSIERCNPN